MHLRPYQEMALKKLTKSTSRSVLLVAPTGAGKGTMATHLMAAHARQGKRVLFLVHRREIVHDIKERLKAKGIHCASTLYSDRKVRVVSVQSALRAQILPVDLIVVDEAHHYAADEWKLVMDRIQTNRIVGFTATPQRADGRSMGDMFEEIIDVVSYSQLIRQEHLTPCRVLRPRESIGKDQLALGPAEAYLRYGRNERTIIFVRRVKEAEEVAAELRLAGVRAEALHGVTAKKHRDQVLTRLEQGELQVVVNVGILTEGVDMPHVTSLVLARPCAHASTYVQIVGRVLRRAPDKKIATVIDLVGASFVHGLPNQDRIYSLEGVGMEQRTRDSRSGPSGEHTPMGDIEIELLDLDLVEIKPMGFNTAPLPPTGSLTPEPKPTEEPFELTKRQKSLLARAELLRELGIKQGKNQQQPRENGKFVPGHTRSDYTPHGTSPGFVFQDRGFWNASWTQDRKKVRLGLCCKEESAAKKLLEILRTQGPEALRDEVRKRKRNAMTLYKERASSLWALRRWNEDRTARLTVKLSTSSLEHAEHLRDLFLQGRDEEAKRLIYRYQARSEAKADEKRAETMRARWAARKATKDARKTG